jgi:hypothetical protein
MHTDQYYKNTRVLDDQHRVLNQALDKKLAQFSLDLLFK